MEKKKKKSKLIEKYIAWIPRAKTQYRCHLQNYFDFLEVEPDTYFKKERDYITDIRKYAVHIKTRAPSSQKVMLNVIKNFLIENDITLKPRIWLEINKRNQISGRRTTIEEEIPNNYELKQILQHGQIKDRALFLVTATSGMRIGEVVALTFTDIDNRHIIVRASGTKKNYMRHTFITDEAQSALNEWLKVRAKYITIKWARSRYERKRLEKEGFTFKHNKGVWTVFKDGTEISFEDVAKQDDRLFPFGIGTAIRMWNRMLESSGTPYNEKDKNPTLMKEYYKFHIHTLRKFYDSQLGSTRINKQHLKAMIGHMDGMDAVYQKFRPDVLKVSYDEYSKCLAVFSDKNLIDSEYKPKLQAMDTNISSLVSENRRLKGEIEKMKQTQSDLDAKDHFEGLDVHYQLKDKDNRIKELEDKVKLILESVKNMGK